MEYKSNAILKNLYFLCQNLCDLLPTLTKLVEEGIISKNEKEEIECKKVSFSRNEKLFSILLKKDMNLKLLADILRTTNNQHLADKLETHPENLLPIESSHNRNKQITIIKYEGSNVEHTQQTVRITTRPPLVSLLKMEIKTNQIFPNQTETAFRRQSSVTTGNGSIGIRSSFRKHLASFS